MRTPSKSRRFVVVAAVLATFAVMAASPAAADPSESQGGWAHAGYNPIPSKIPGNVDSVAFEANALNEFGDEVGLGGTGRALESMSVVLSSWGCSESGAWYSKTCVTSEDATFDVPLTFTIYADNAGIPGAVLATRTKTVAVPYRPSASAKCTGTDAGKWYSERDRTCYNGLSRVVTMDMPRVSLPAQVIWTVKFNTTHYGPNPIGQQTACYGTSNGCGYDSLNVGIKSFPRAPFVGTDISVDTVLWNGTPWTDVGWAGYRPLGAIALRSGGSQRGRD